MKKNFKIGDFNFRVEREVITRGASFTYYSIMGENGAGACIVEEKEQLVSIIYYDRVNRRNITKSGKGEVEEIFQEIQLQF